MIYRDDTPELGEINYPYPKNKAIEISDLSNNRGIIIEVEGVDGSGKSTQCKLLYERLKRTYNVYYTNFIHSDYIKVPLLKTKWENCDPYTFSLMYAMGLQHTYTMDILPRLKKNIIVVLDRYVVTVHLKSILRGISEEWIQTVTSAIRPADIKILIDTPPEICMKRKLSKNGMLTYWECGGSEAIRKYYNEELFKNNFLEYQTKAQCYLRNIANRDNWAVFNGVQSVQELNDNICKFLSSELDRTMRIGY